MNSQPARIANIKFFDDLKLEVHDGDIISESIFQQSVWEEDLSLKLLEIAQKDGGLLVDVGANIGYFSLLWARANASNEVLAFEASPRIIPKLISNVRLNGLLGQIHCLGTALGSASGILRFVLGPEEQTGWGGLMERPDGPSCKVACVRLDELLGLTAIRVLKIDVEGADTLVLKGCERLLRAGLIKEIFYEQNLPRMQAIGINQDDARAFLESVGYRVEPLSNPDDAVSEWRATPKTV